MGGLKTKGETLKGEWDERLTSFKQKLGAA